MFLARVRLLIKFAHITGAPDQLSTLRGLLSTPKPDLVSN
jgi:hypothetical protein